MDQTKEPCKTTSSKEPHECKWEYQQDADFDWFECTVCGAIRNKEYVP